MIPQEHQPLARLGNRRRLLEDIQDRKAVLHVDAHEQPRHDRKMERRVALVAVAEIRDGVLRPLVGFGQQHPSGKSLVDVLPELFQKRVRLRQIFAVGAFALVEIGNRVQPHTIDARLQPIIDEAEQRLVHLRIVEIQVRLVRIEPVPVIRFRQRIPRPIRDFEILEDDPRVGVFLRRVAPDVELPSRAARLGPPCALKPRMLVGSVIHH